MASIIIPEAIALVSSVELLPSDALPEDAQPQASGRNVALHRPCHPAPLCSALVDSNKGTSVNMEQGHTSLSGWQRGSMSQSTQNTFKIFLQQPFFVSNIVILCSAD